MGLIKREEKPVMVGVRLKLEAGLFASLEEYAEYMQSSLDHIVAEAVDYVIARDKEFAKARGERGRKAAKKVAEIA